MHLAPEERSHSQAPPRSALTTGCESTVSRKPKKTHAVGFELVPIENRGDATHDLAVLQGKKISHVGMRVERVLLLVKQVFLRNSERRSPIGIVPVVPVRELNKLPKGSTIVRANYGHFAH